MDMRISSYSLTFGSVRKVMVALALGLSTAPLAAQTTAQPTAQAAPQTGQAVELSGEVQVERVIREGGKERRVLEQPDTVLPGDKLVFTTRYNNVGGDVVKDFVVTNPLPQAIRLAAEDAGVLELSVDGARSWGKLAALTVADGKGGKRPAVIDDVTHIRWTIAQLAPGAKGAVTYRGTVR